MTDPQPLEGDPACSDPDCSYRAEALLAQPLEGEDGMVVAVKQLKADLQAAHQRIEELERKLVIFNGAAHDDELRIDTLTAERDGYREALEVFAATPEDYSNDDIRSLARAALAPDDSGSEHQEGEDG